MPHEMWPSTLDDFWGYWNQKIETLEVADWARSLCNDLLYPKHTPIWPKPLSPGSKAADGPAAAGQAMNVGSMG